MKRDFSTKLAEFVSIIFNPILLGLMILIATIYQSRMSDILELGWVIATSVLNGIVLALIYWYLRLRGYVFDDSIDDKKIKHGRLLLLIIILILVSLELLVLVSTKVYQPLLAVFMGGISTIILGSIITYYWKISWHTSAMTFFLAMFFLLYGWKIWPMIFLLILLFWARMWLRRHTFWQLMSGVIVSLLVMYLVFTYFQLL